MIEDEKIIVIVYERSEQAIQELNSKYGKVFHALSYNMTGSIGCMKRFWGIERHFRTMPLRFSDYSVLFILSGRIYNVFIFFKA